MFLKSDYCFQAVLAVFHPLFCTAHVPRDCKSWLHQPLPHEDSSKFAVLGELTIYHDTRSADSGELQEPISVLRKEGRKEEREGGREGGRTGVTERKKERKKEGKKERKKELK